MDKGNVPDEKLDKGKEPDERPVQDREIFRAIIGNYSIGIPVSTVRLKQGYANTNFRLETTEGTYLLRIFREKSEDEILYEMRVLERLKREGFPAAYPILRSDGGCLTVVGGRRIAIYQYIEGEEPEINERTVGEIARAVARLNSIEIGGDLKRENALNIGRCRKLIERLSESALGAGLKGLRDYLIKETEALSDVLKEPLPTGLVHGDVFPDNTRFSGSRLIALLDFEEVCTDHLLYDVGMTINGFCFPDNRLDEGLMKQFLRKYNAVRKLSERERELLPYYILWGAHAMACWHIEHLLDIGERVYLERARVFMGRVRALREAGIALI